MVSKTPMRLAAAFSRRMQILRSCQRAHAKAEGVGGSILVFGDARQGDGLQLEVERGRLR